MKRLGKVLLAGLGAGLGAMIVWRIASNRLALPCPSWLSWLLEIPLLEGVSAGSILDRLDLQPGMRILDVGSGAGRVSIPAARRVGPQGEVVALDMQPSMLRKAQLRAVAAGIKNIRFHLGRAGGGLLEHAAFDRALLVTVLGEIPNRLEALREIFLALKPGGILSVSEVFPDPHFQTPAAVRYLAGQAGFEEGDFFGRGPAFTIHFRKPILLSGSEGQN